MIKEIIAQGKDVNEAKENARAALGVTELDDVQFEVLHIGSKGIFGIIGVKPAQVRAYIEIPDREERRRGDKKDRKREKPKHEAESQNAEAVSGETEVSSEKPAQNSQPKKKNNNKKKNNTRANEIREAIKSEPSKPKSEVIPERELKLTLREVGEGEDMSFDFIRTVILDTGLNATAELYSCDDGTRRIAIKGEDASILIGHHGDTLEAFQYLVNLAANKKDDEDRQYTRITVNVENYREKREDTLRKLAAKMAAKVKKSGRNIALEPMNAYERRIIHAEIQKIDGVSTNSVGAEGNRRVVIFPEGGAKPTEAKPGTGKHRNDRKRDDRAKREPKAENAERSADTAKKNDYAKSDRRERDNYVPRKRPDTPRPAPRKIEKAKDLDSYFAKLKEFSSNNSQS